MLLKFLLYYDFLAVRKIAEHTRIKKKKTHLFES